MYRLRHVGIVGNIRQRGERGILRPSQKMLRFHNVDKKWVGVFGAVFCSKVGGSIRVEIRTNTA
jgi:hypothetical protein